MSWIDDNPSIKKMKDTLKKKYKYDTIKKMSESLLLDIPRLPFRVFELDVACGGGVPIGRVTLVWGKRSACKSTLCYRLIANAMQTDRNTYKHKSEVANFEPMRCAYVDIEATTSTKWTCDTHNVIPEDALLARPQTGEEAVDTVISLVYSEAVDLIIVDSLAAMSPEREVENSADDGMQGGQAKLVSKFCRKLVAAMNHCLNRSQEDPKVKVPTVILINQLRQKPGVMMGSPDVKPAGISQENVCSIEVKISPASVKDPSNKKDVEGMEVYKDLTYRFFTEKNKTFTPYLSGEFYMRSLPDEERDRGDFYEDETLLKKALQYGLMTPGKWVVCGKTFKSKGELQETLKLDRTFENLLREELMKTVLPKIG